MCECAIHTQEKHNWFGEKKNIALLPFLTSGGMSTANTQNTLFTQNNIRRYRQYVLAAQQLWV